MQLGEGLVQVAQLQGLGPGVGLGVGVPTEVGAGVGWGVADKGLLGAGVFEVALGPLEGSGVAVTPEPEGAAVTDEPDPLDGELVGASDDVGALDGCEAEGWAMDCCEVSEPVALGAGTGLAVLPAAITAAAPTESAPVPAHDPILPSSLQRRPSVGICPTHAPKPMVRQRRPTEMLRKARTIAGSSWVPAARVSSARAVAMLIARL